MSLASKITKLKNNIIAAYSACSNKGATIPVEQNSDNLAECISSIPESSGANIEALEITPSISQQIITASGDVDGYSPITVSAVTNSIDDNITAGNIKKDVQILGVTGTFEGSGDIGIPREVNQSGFYQMPTQNFTFSLPSNAKDVNYYALSQAFQSCIGLTDVDLSSLIEISGSYALYQAFIYCTKLTSADLSSLKIISGSNGLSQAFRSCTNLVNVNLLSLEIVSGSGGLSGSFQNCSSLQAISFPALKTISGSYGLSTAFYDCKELVTVDLSSLKTISETYGLNSTFLNCTKLANVDLSSLETISGNYALSQAFYNCVSLQTISFPSLTSSSFGSRTTQFYSMLYGVTGCTVHFPSNLQSVISSWSDVTNGFGGTNTTVLFDLPATS